jgi:ankyrin repeat protein
VLGNLHEACEQGDLEMVVQLLDAGASPNVKAYGFTPLHAASACGAAEIASLLLERGAEIEALTDAGVTPLMFAITENYPELVKLLLEHNARPDASMPGGWTGVHMSAGEGHGAVLKLLLAAGAPVDAPDDTGLTPLHHAVRNQHTAIVSILLDAGADPNRLSVAGESALDMAEATGHEDLPTLLESHGAQRGPASAAGRRQPAPLIPEAPGEFGLAEALTAAAQGVEGPGMDLVMAAAQQAAEELRGEGWARHRLEHTEEGRKALIQRISEILGLRGQKESRGSL